MFKQQANSIAVGFAGVALMLGAMSMVVGIQSAHAADETGSAAHFGVTDADLEMYSEGTNGSFENEELPSPEHHETEEQFDYSFIFPSEPGADDGILMRLGARDSE